MNKRTVVIVFALALVLFSFISAADEESRNANKKRAREYGLQFGVLSPGQHNNITDVEGVLAGHYSLHKPPRFNTGITAILPHGGNLFHEKVPAAIEVCNGFGKLMGSTQVNELGELETPILLTGTLNVPKVADGLIDYMLSLPDMEHVYSINPVVGETNDGFLSDIRARPLDTAHVKLAIENASSGQVLLGSVGAGSSTRCLGYKGGIGSSSRQLPDHMGGWTIGVLVQTNFGGILTFNGKQLGLDLNPDLKQRFSESRDKGSIMIVVATDAPLDHRNLRRLARRAFLGMARTGGYASNGSGDYAIAFSTHDSLRIRRENDPALMSRVVLDNSAVSGLFMACAEATEEAIIDSLFMATSVEGFLGNAEELPVDKVLKLLDVAGN